MTEKLGIRWTVGDVSQRGFEALRLSLWGAHLAFGDEIRMAVVVNSLPPEEAKRRTGDVPRGVVWLAAGEPPGVLADFLDEEMAEGVAWKLAPPRVFPDIHELSLDNDCILWSVPPAIFAWMEEEAPRCLIAADVTLALGAFTEFTRPEPRNTGIRGLPPHHDLPAALERVLREHPVKLRSELDEQGLQAAAFDLDRPAHIVSTDDVSICSPFWPHQPDLGRHGAHFVGLNARRLPWTYYRRPASECVAENWERHRPELYRRVGLKVPEDA
ncbi:hypothetical protein [Chelativorans sp. AA-79]|uniref:hypothetical protein n=1 Tax=Chelativorans sp. AA-79 TaxID=3028735 RepID=UPI0023F9B7F4|nr:hypothetical protein [Chelativorans sp. AA-79]WEX10409.1 hypothetical protein PVE73_05485 [Chelativorans sp. AA-79]